MTLRPPPRAVVNPVPPISCPQHPPLPGPPGPAGHPLLQEALPAQCCRGWGRWRLETLWVPGSWSHALAQATQLVRGPGPECRPPSGATGTWVTAEGDSGVIPGHSGAGSGMPAAHACAVHKGGRAGSRPSRPGAGVPPLTRALRQARAHLRRGLGSPSTQAPGTRTLEAPRPRCLGWAPGNAWGSARDPCSGSAAAPSSAHPLASN